jgi:hypothetical protein
LWARKLGYTNVYRQPNGIFAWAGKDDKVEKSRAGRRLFAPESLAAREIFYPPHSAPSFFCQFL